MIHEGAKHWLFHWTGPFAFLMIAMRESTHLMPRPHAKFLRTQALLVHVTSAIYLMAAASLLTQQKNLLPLLGDGLFWTTWAFAVFQVTHYQHERNVYSFAARITTLVCMGITRIVSAYATNPHVLNITHALYLICIMMIFLEPFYGAEDQVHEKTI